MRTLALCGASCKRRSSFYCTGAAWKSLQLLPLLSFYLYLWSRVVSGGPGPCGLGLWASRMNFACTEFYEVACRPSPSPASWQAPRGSSGANSCLSAWRAGSSGRGYVAAAQRLLWVAHLGEASTIGDVPRFSSGV
jgi:hypothetical protein